MKIIKAVGSLIVTNDGTERGLDELSAYEREIFNEKMYHRINMVMNEYYSEHKDEWIKLAEHLSGK